MPSVASNLSCQVDGLLKIYTYTERNVFFEFENQQKLQKAKEVFMRCITDKHMLHLTPSITPEYTNFAFNVSADVNAPINSAKELILFVSDIIATETSLKKDIPIVPIIMEQLVYKD